MNESFELHDTLNPVLWENDSLKPDIEDALNNIVLEYINNSDVLKEDNVIDAQLVGSNASFNYTDKSDLDLHLVVNMEDLSCDPEMVQLACNAEKVNFNKTYNLFVKGIKVELYVEDVKASTASNGIYSLFKNEWVKYPEKIEGIDYNNDTTFQNELNNYINRIHDILSGTSNSVEIQKEINNLYNMRRESIMSEGEFGFGNQLFKEIRNLGLLDELKDKQHELIGKELSLESLKESIFSNRTNMPKYDRLMDDPDYNDDWIAEIKLLSPKEYFRDCAKYIFDTTPEVLIKEREQDVETMDKLKSLIQNEVQLDLPVISYAGRRQEGLHRMLAAAELFGWDEKFPVLTISWKDELLGENKMKKYRVNYLLKEDYHYSIIDAMDEEDALNSVENYFDDEDEFKILSVEEDRGPKEGPDAGISNLIINAINDEWNTISYYNDLAITARLEGREDIAKVIDDIAQEENKHVGQLQEIMKTLSPMTSEIKQGEEEGKEQLENIE